MIAQLNLQPDIEKLYGAPYLLIHRAELHQVLVKRAYAVGVKIELDTFVSMIDQAEPSVTLKNGTSLKADLVIGADGKTILSISAYAH